MIRRLALAGAALTVLLAAAPARAAECGPLPAAPWLVLARAVDGDTLVVVGTPIRIRLFGIDAPELRGGALQREALAARAHLDEIVLDKEVACAPVAHDRWCRIVATCAVAGKDLGAAMLGAGWAWTMPGYLHGPAAPNGFADVYDVTEMVAKIRRLGIWAWVPR